MKVTLIILFHMLSYVFSKIYLYLRSLCSVVSFKFSVDVLSLISLRYFISLLRFLRSSSNSFLSLSVIVCNFFLEIKIRLIHLIIIPFFLSYKNKGYEIYIDSGKTENCSLCKVS